MLDYETGFPNRFSRTEGRIRGAPYGVAYPSPFFDVAHTYLPASIKQMFRWCRYYTLTNPLIAATVNKMAEYPVTDVILDTDNSGVKELWTDFFEETLKLRSFMIDVGLFYQCYGNSLVSISYPFIKFLKCRLCGGQVAAKEAAYKFRGFHFLLDCPKCHNSAEADAFDVYVKSPTEIRLILWNPEDISIRFNELTGKAMYYYTLPQFLRNDILLGRRETVETVPQLFVDAVKKEKAIVLSPDNVFHFRKPSILSASRDRGWGIPLILPVLKDTFYLQVLKKAQECVALNTLIETPSGLVRADDVSIGDTVRTHTGEWHSVVEKWYRDCKEEEIGRKITLASMRALPSTFSPNHPIFSLARNDVNRRKDTKEQQRSSIILRVPHLYEEVLRPADQLNVGDYVLYPRRLPTNCSTIDIAAVTGLFGTDNYVYSGGCSIETARAFELLEVGEKSDAGNGTKAAKRTLNEGRTPKRLRRHIDLSPQLGYILGWYAGDGSSGTGHFTISMGLKDNPQEFCNAVVEAFNIEPRVRPVDNIINVDVNDVIVSKLIKGLIPGTARTKNVPSIVLNSSDDVKLAFLRGLWEADGYKDSDRAILSTSSQDIAYGVYRLLLHFGCIANVSLHITPATELPEGRIIKESSGFHVIVSTASKNRLVALFDNCIDVPEVTSGKSGFFWGKDYFASRVCAVEEVKEDAYIDFKVDHDTTFCTPATATKNSIALERIVPLSVLFPQPGSGSSDPYSSISLVKWREQVALEIQRWRFDRNYMPIMPLPIGHQVIGGDGRALLLGQEIRVWSEQIIAGMGVPQEFIFGGLQYCLRGLTRIFTVDGTEFLKDVVEKGNLVEVLTEDGPRKITKLHEIGKKPALKLRTVRGFELIGAGTHPVLVLTSDLQLIYRDLSEIEEGDYVVTKRGSSLWPKSPASLPSADRVERQMSITVPDRLTKDVAALFGYITSEGYIKEDRLNFANTDKEVMDDFVRCFKSVFHFEPFIQYRSSDAGKDFWVVDVSRKTLCSFLLKCGIGGRSYEKQIPPSILLSPASYVAAYLSAYFEGDGGVSLKNSGGGHICAVTASDDLAHDIQLLLLKLGVLSSRYPKSKASPVNKIVIRGRQDLIRFKEVIGFRSAVKKDRLNELIGSVSEKHSDHLPYIREALCLFRDRIRIGNNNWQWEPFEFKATKEFYSFDEIAAILDRSIDTVVEHVTKGRLEAEKIETEWVVRGEVFEEFGKHYGRGVQAAFPRLHKGATRYNLRKVDLSLVEDKDPDLFRNIKNILDSDFVFDEVDSIEDAGVEMMYDLTVEGTHSYIADGLITHNSGSNVSLRMLENHFLRYISDLLRMVKTFIIPNVSAFLDWPTIGARFKPFKMADDLQRRAFDFQLNNAGKISDTTLLANCDFDQFKEDELIQKETSRREDAVKKSQIASATVQGEMNLVQAKYQARAQAIMQQEQAQALRGEQHSAPGEAGEAVPGQLPSPQQQPEQQPQQQQGASFEAMVQQLVQQVSSAPQEFRQQMLQQIASQNPELAQVVTKQVGQANKPAAQSSAAQPLPQQLPPRRGPENAII